MSTPTAPRAPRAPDVGAADEVWEAWIERFKAHAAAKGILIDRSYHSKFEDYKKDAMKGFGTNWATALHFGDDKKHIKVMETNWRYFTYIALTGRKPSFAMKHYR